uniref:Uncharacterized protein n=1 Tax=Arundo donax TaxID=35708 RepID=A0A0A9B8N9_ARUDO
MSPSGSLGTCPGTAAPAAPAPARRHLSPPRSRPWPLACWYERAWERQSGV